MSMFMSRFCFRRKLVKTVKSVTHSQRKMYITFDKGQRLSCRRCRLLTIRLLAEPAKSVSGGSFYTDSHLDSTYVSMTRVCSALMLYLRYCADRAHADCCPNHCRRGVYLIRTPHTYELFIVFLCCRWVARTRLSQLGRNYNAAE
jgi:hypothetical protein